MNGLEFLELSQLLKLENDVNFAKVAIHKHCIQTLVKRESVFYEKVSLINILHFVNCGTALNYYVVSASCTK